MADFVFDADALATALESAGYDVDPTPAGLAQVSARRESAAGSVATVVVDGAGRLRFSLTRDVAPERARDLTVGGQRVQLVTNTSRTTVALVSLATPTDLVPLLEALESAAAR